MVVSNSSRAMPAAEETSEQEVVDPARRLGSEGAGGAVIVGMLTEDLAPTFDRAQLLHSFSQFILGKEALELPSPDLGVKALDLAASAASLRGRPINR